MRLWLPWGPPRPLPRRPYRDAAILYAILAAVIVGFALATGGGLAKALIVAAVFFVVATGWSWWRFREKLAERGRR